MTPSTSDGDWQFLVCGLQHSLQIDFMPPPKKRIQVRIFGALTSESVFLKMEALVGWLSSLWPENHAVFNLLARDRNGMERKIRKKQISFLCFILFFQVGREMPHRVTKTPSARQQCWPESFCKSGKFLQHVHYGLKRFRIIWKNAGMLYKISR